MKNDYIRKRNINSYNVGIHYVCLARYMYSNRDIGFILLRLGNMHRIPFSLDYIQYSSTMQSLLKENKISIDNCVFTEDCELKPLENSGIVVINLKEPENIRELQDALRYYTPPKEVLDLIDKHTRYRSLYAKYKDVLQQVGIGEVYDLFYLHTIIDEYTSSIYNGKLAKVNLERQKHFYVDYSDFKGTFLRLVTAELQLFDIASYILDLNINIIKVLVGNKIYINEPYNLLEWRIYADVANVKFYMCFHFNGGLSDPFAFDYSLANIEFSLYALCSYSSDHIRNVLNSMTDMILRSRFGIQIN